MAELREVFEMTTKQLEPDQDSWRKQEERHHRDARRKKFGALAVAAAIGLAGIVAAALVTSDRGGTPAPSVGAEPGGTQALSIVDVRSGTSAAFTAPLGAWGFDVTRDGSTIAYVDTDEAGNEQVFVMGADGSNAMQLTHGEGHVGAVAVSHTPAGPIWSPDGSMIAYEWDAPGDPPQIFVVGVSDGVSTQVTHEPQGAVNPGGWAPDGGSLIFSSLNPEITHYSAYSVDLETGRTNLIVTDGSTPTLSPDGTRIAFNSWLKRDVRLILANNDGSDRRVIARLHDSAQCCDDGYQRWSPDSTQIAYVGNTDGAGVGTHVYDLASGGTRFVTAGRIEAWIDDGHILVS